MASVDWRNWLDLFSIAINGLIIIIVYMIFVGVVVNHSYFIVIIKYWKLIEVDLYFDCIFPDYVIKVIVLKWINLGQMVVVSNVAGFIMIKINCIKLYWAPELDVVTIMTHFRLGSAVTTTKMMIIKMNYSVFKLKNDFLL